MDLSQLYRDIVETSPDGIWVVDLEGRTLYANPEIARIHRVAPEALGDLSVLDILDPAGREQFAVHLAEAREGRIHGSEVEVQWVRSDGDIVWMLVQETALLGDDGRPRALLHRYSDHTERHALIASLQASEEALEDQVAQNNLMQAVASAANEATSLGDVLVHARSLVLLHDDWERARAFVPAADGSGQVEPFYPVDADREMDAGDPQAATELSLAQRAHDARGLVWDERRLTVAFPVLLGEEVYAVLAITSAPPLYRFELIETMVGRVAEQLARVAERERAQAEVALARDQAMEGSRQKSEFLATMSHEIRTPLNGVLGLNELLLRSSLTPEQQRLSTGVQMASRTLLGLINDMLDFSKIEAGHLELERLDFEVRPLLEQVVGMFTEPVRDKALDLVLSCNPDVPAVLSGDPTRLAQVVTNLVSNAVKFTERGGVVVRVTAEPADGRVAMRIEVSDSGVGVPRSKVAHLFDPFTQADSSTTRIYGGTGLGLAISSELVAAMDGSVEYTPNPGGGSIFTCSVLVDEGTESFVDQSPDTRARARLTGSRLLVVADDPMHAWVWAEQLAWWGLDVETSTSMTQARSLLDSAPYDALLVDLDDGLELRVAGVREALSKPVLPSELRGALLRLVAGEARPAEVAAVAEQPSKGLILVVEDNPVNQLVATGLLTALGYATEVADDGSAAIEAAHDRGYDAILMDVQMPHMDGYTATRLIRAREAGRRRPIIAMTAAVTEGERERCLDAGMDDFLTKPVDAARLAETLERWLRPEPPYAARLDLDRLAELRELDDPGDGQSYVDRAIANFLGSAEDQVDAMGSAGDSGDIDQLRAVAHRLAGSALNLGAVALGEGARGVEELIVNGSVAEAMTAVTALRERLEADLDALRAYQRDQFPARVG
jgi:PAS domain S-box-containing protein